VKAGTATRTMSVIAVLAFALLILGCASDPARLRTRLGAEPEDWIPPGPRAEPART
jgi:hypothetical protein